MNRENDQSLAAALDRELQLLDLDERRDVRYLVTKITHSFELNTICKNNLIRFAATVGHKASIVRPPHTHTLRWPGERACPSRVLKYSSCLSSNQPTSLATCLRFSPTLFFAHVQGCGNGELVCREADGRPCGSNR